MINKKSIIFITGQNGVVGSSVVSALKKNGFKINTYYYRQKKLNLLETKKVFNFIKKKK